MEYTYVGSELDIFSEARNWKTYFSQRVKSYLRGIVVEVGAGIGANTPFLSNGANFIEWISLEPDSANFERLNRKLLATPTVKNIRAVHGMIPGLLPKSVNTLLYIDVLEHIKDDRSELNLAAEKLKPGGYLIVLSPAHQGLFSNFDRSIGHFRRYTKKSLLELAPADCVIREAVYLDSVGLIASYANRILLKQKMPTLQQILFWDRVIVPLSRFLDRLLGFKLGKTILVVWQKN